MNTPSRSRLVALGLVLPAALSAGACSGEADVPSGVATTAGPGSSATPVTASTSTAAAAVSSTAAPTTAAAPIKTVTLARFQTPTGNIACDATDGIRCDIQERTWMPPPKPATCELDWGNGFAILPDGTPTGVCAGDTVLDRSLPKLAYGEASRVGPITCTSRIDGLTCTHDRTRRGFFLSKGSYRLF